MLSLDQGRHSMDIVGVAENGGSQRGHGQANSPRGVALQTDNFVGTLDDLLVQLLPVLRIIFGSNGWVDFTQTHSSNINARPHWYRRISVLT